MKQVPHWGLKILGATVKKLVATATWCLGAIVNILVATATWCLGATVKELVVTATWRLGATLKKLVAAATWRVGFVNPCVCHNIWRFRCGGYRDNGFPECGVVLFGRQMPTFWYNLPSRTSVMWRQLVPPKFWYCSTKLIGVTSHKIPVFVSKARSPNCKKRLLAS